MKLAHLLAASVLLALTALTACTSELAPARPNAAPPRAPEIGWTLLGGREIDGKSDRELFVIVDGPDCDEIRISAVRGQAEVTSFGVSFTDGQRFVPHAPIVFDALHRDHVLRIPGGRRQVAQVDFRVRRLAPEPLEVAVSGR